MNNWKTTILGAAIAAVSAIAIYQKNGGDLSDWKQYVIPALFAALGYVAKDSKGTALILASCLLLPSCATNARGEKTFLELTGDDWVLLGKEAAITGAKAGAADAFLRYGERRTINVTATK